MSQLDEGATVVAARPLRVDAQRNRERLVAEAATAFQERGIDVPLEELARRSDVGIGTLYRHFPTRDALIEAVYRHEMDLLCDAAADLRNLHPPGDALELWLLNFVDYVAAKRGMAEALKAAVGADSELFAESHRRITQAIEGLVATGVEAGVVRGDVEPLDLLRAVSGICTSPSAALPDWDERARRLVSLVMDGMRYGA
jgi:AcrR family transcriptional regulator